MAWLVVLRHPLWKSERCRLERANQTLDALVVALEWVLAENGLALRIVELEIDPVHSVVLALDVGLTDEFAPQPGPRGLRGHVLGALDGLIVGDAIHHFAAYQTEVEALFGPDVVVLKCLTLDFTVLPVQPVLYYLA